MATLAGRQPNNTYKDLLQVSNSNAGVDGTLRDIEDGEGTASGLQLATTGAKIASGKTLTIAGTIDISAASYTGDVPVAAGGTGASTAGSARTNLALSSADSPQFTGIELGHATDTTLTRSTAGNVAIEGNVIYRAGGTDVPVTDGGTGASTAATARTNLGLGDAATKTVGVANGNVIAADATGLPAINGSQLTALTRANITSLPGPTMQKFEAGGTWTRPSGCRRIKVICTAGGGGGGGSDNAHGIGAGGGAGETAISYIDVTSLASAAVAVGAAGAAGADTGGDGGVGGNSTFGTTTVVATGGTGGGGVSAADEDAGGAGGTGGTGDLLLIGGDGGPGGWSDSADVQITGGWGGASYWGGGASGRVQAKSTSAAGAAGKAWGSGGGGGASNSVTGQAGGAGKAGIVVVEEFY